MTLLEQKEASYLLGLLQGLYIDKAFTNRDAIFFLNSLKKYPELLLEKSLNNYAIFLKNKVEDNHYSLITLEKTKKIMSELLGVPVNKHRCDAENPPFQKIPFTEIDKIELAGNSFVLSGVFKDRKTNVENYIEVKGGYCELKCTRSTDYLIVGGINSPEWTFGNYGRKIEKAVNYKIPIISEKKFLKLTNNLM